MDGTTVLSIPKSPPRQIVDAAPHLQLSKIRWTPPKIASSVKLVSRNSANFHKIKRSHFPRFSILPSYCSLFWLLLPCLCPVFLPPFSLCSPFPESTCSNFPSNPCGVGICTDTVPGRYTCVCPFGYGLTTSTLDLSPTCAPAPIVPGVQYYTVPQGSTIECDVLWAMYGLTKDQFLAQNPVRISTPVLGVLGNLGVCEFIFEF